MSDISWMDYAALTWFFVCWAGYTLLADHGRWRRRSISARMAYHRHRWMEQMLARELRMVDTTILGNLLTGISFFASATILVLGGLGALLGATEQALNALGALPFADPGTPHSFAAKVVLLILIFIYAFFKFAWSFRLTNYCSILVGSAPAPCADAEPVTAARAARMSMLAAHHFNRGLRAYFFALAALGWFLHPALFVAASTGVVAVVYRREFASRALRILD